MWLIISLVVIGALLLVVELILLPGFSVAGICALLSFGTAIYLGFTDYGTSGGLLTLFSSIAVAVAATAISLRARTWQRLALNQSIDGTSQPLPEEELKVGDPGVTATRLAPLGKIYVGENTYEARAVGDAFLDPRTRIEVVDFENFTVIVRPAENNL